MPSGACGHAHVAVGHETFVDPGWKTQPTARQRTGLSIWSARRRPTSQEPPVTFVPAGMLDVPNPPGRPSLEVQARGVVVQLIQYPRFSSSRTPSGDFERSQT